MSGSESARDGLGCWRGCATAGVVFEWMGVLVLATRFLGPKEGLPIAVFADLGGCAAACAAIFLTVPIASLAWVEWRARGTSRAWRVLLVAHALAVSLGLVLQYLDSASRAVRNAQPLVHALERYVRDHGEAPPSLEALVPGYLRDIPDTRTPSYRGYEYRLCQRREARLEVATWDLGKRSGIDSARECDEDLVLPDDDAWLAFVIDGAEIVERGCVVGLQPQQGLGLFDAATWRRDASTRRECARTALRELDARWRSIGWLVERLGTPDARTVLRSRPWELSIRCHGSWLDWFGGEELDYRPESQGRGVRRIDGWRLSRWSS